MKTRNTDYYGYLFVHFVGESEIGEQIYFSISKDGLHWQDLNNGEPVLYATIGELGVRDPFIIRSEDEEKYYIIGTDLRIANEKGWHVAQHEGSRDLLVWESNDLVNWSEVRNITVGVPGAGCVWAPEAIYDKDNKDYFVFWASMVKSGDNNEPKQVMYYSRTKDFKHFTEAKRYIERDNHVIDTTMIEENGIYYRYSKDESTKNIRIDRADQLTDTTFVELHKPTVENLMGVEGPIIFKFNDREEWCLLVDQYATMKGYLPLITSDLENGDFRVLEPEEYCMGNTKKRHGSVLKITENEYNQLVNKYHI